MALELDSNMNTTTSNEINHSTTYYPTKLYDYYRWGGQTAPRWGGQTAPDWWDHNVISTVDHADVDAMMKRYYTTPDNDDSEKIVACDRVSPALASKINQ